MPDLSGSTAIVTGGARGIGLAMAGALAKCGASIGLIDLLPEVSDSAANLANETGVVAAGVIADVRDAKAVEAAVEDLQQQLGTADLLITSAGITIWGDSTEVTPVDWQRVLDKKDTDSALRRKWLQDIKGKLHVSKENLRPTRELVKQVIQDAAESAAGPDAIPFEVYRSWGVAAVRAQARLKIDGLAHVGSGAPAAAARRAYGAERHSNLREAYQLHHRGGRAGRG